MEENLKNQYLATKNANDQGMFSSRNKITWYVTESQKNNKEYEELNQLRELKKKL